MDQRTLAEKILLDNMSDNTAKYLSEIRYLTDWIVDAMLEYNKVFETEENKMFHNGEVVGSFIKHCEENGLDIPESFYESYFGA